MKKYQILAPYY